MHFKNSNQKVAIYILLFFGSLLTGTAIAGMGDIVYTLPIPDTIQPHCDGGIEHDGTHLWAPVSRLAPEVRVYEIDPSNGDILRSYPQTHYDPSSSNVIGLAYDSSDNLMYNQVYPYGPIYAVDGLSLDEVPGSAISAPAPWIHDITFDSANQILWAVTGDSIHSNYRVYKIRPSDGYVMGSFTTPTNAPNPSGLAWDGSYLWVADSDQNLYRVDQDQALLDGNCDNAIIRQIDLPELGVSVGRLAWDGKYLWSHDTNNFYQISVAGNGEAPIFVRRGDGGLCLIATAAYGSCMGKEVEVLKRIRDEYLLRNELGRIFVSMYYRYSPPLAHWIGKYPMMRKIARVGLYPTLVMSKWIVGEKPSELGSNKTN